MASVRRISSGWQAQVARKGVRASRTFPTKREAQDWAAREEHLILAGEGKYAGGIFADLLRRYARTESPKKRGGRWEDFRLALIARDKIGQIRIKDLSSADLADWRDRRSKQVKSNTVRREMQLLSAVFTVAVKEWEVLPRSPLKGVAMPRKPERRKRLVSDDEIARLIAVAGADLGKIKGRAVHAFRFACLSAMRAGELLALRRVDIQGRVARLHTSKTGKGRDVPLSTAALALWGVVRQTRTGLKRQQVPHLLARKEFVPLGIRGGSV